MKILPEDPKTSLTIKGLEFSISEPFKEGHVLTSNEANVMNQTLRENIRNNFAYVLAELQETAAKGETILDIPAVQAQLDKYVEDYEFGVRRGGGRMPADPVEKEALTIAKDLIRGALKKAGKKLSGEGAITSANIYELAEKLLNNPDKSAGIYKLAKKNVSDRERLAIDSLDIEV